MSRMIRACLSAFLLELRLGIRSKRFLAFAVFFLVPVAMAPVLRWLMANIDVELDEAHLVRYVNFLFFMLVVPLAALLHGSGVVRDDLEDGTWPYHVMTPLFTWQTLLAKYAAAVVLVCALAVPSLFATHTALFAGSQAGLTEHLEFTTRAAAGACLGALAYCAVFAFLGVWVRRPLVIGVIYGLVSEYALQALPGETLVRKFTVIFHVRSVAVPDAMREQSGGGLLELPGFFALEDPSRAALTLVAFAACFVILASFIVTRREFAAAKQ